ncbi:cytochrome d ubiquinol oxidase subunit II [Oleiagrimonas sp. MCCC 1A03011]|jgi:cytochrome bd ubiquinol oxidase subunit II|uniref:cytochrome d ubiquinol oxidase subunit II n=1 Tax=Oleiagrimonas sp. MCCC 1A03011 TaxID=1926883 RepID=UPI000DC4500B|nr:cytochrome d ubiquinol oxidase subunit II [Oleiagrimonas sp. MCCC 1A03011]RAP56260.1 cytochrome d ubiquinol oxidase subunit II [Oleiagrimonas sp. MCCC 1A03011]
MEIYLILKVVWWLLLGVLLMGLAVMVGMDMGVGTILRYVGRNDLERRVALNIIGPHWDGNQVWFILGGGAVFAAFPLIYATAFSGFYVVMLLLLWSMIVRPLGFEYRSKMPSARWRNVWDWSLFVSGFLPMLVFGAAIGNILQGVPFHFSWNLTSYYTGSFLALFNPFAILCGVLSVALSSMMGALTVMNGAEDAMFQRARKLVMVAAAVAVVLFALGGVWVHAIDGFQLVSGPSGNLAQTPMQQTVTQASGAWFGNYSAHPALWLVPLVGFAGVIGAALAARAGRSHLGWWSGALGWIGVIGTVGAAMFPFMMPSSSEPSQSLTLWNATSSQLTLTWMVGFTVVFVPLVVWYTSWAFYVMRGKVKPEHVAADEHAY